MELVNTGLINDASLRAYYRFQTGALTTDSSGNGYTFTTQQGSGTNGRYGGGVAYSQQKSMIASDLGISSGSSALSITCWLKRTTGHSTNNELFIEFAKHNMQLRAGTVEMVFSKGGSDFTVSYVAPLNEWHHYVVTYDGGTTGKVYIDGKLHTSGTFGTSTGSSYFSVGREFDDQDYVIGDMDDVAVFSKELNASEIVILYQDGGAFLMDFV